MDMIKGWEAVFVAAKYLDSNITAMSWNGFNLFGDARSIEELRRLIHVEGRLAWFEREYRREHPQPPTRPKG